MEGMVGLDSMMGLIPMAIGAGIVMKVTDHALGQPQSQRAQRPQSKRKGRTNMKVTQKSIMKAAGSANKGLKKAAKPIKLGKGNSDPSGTSVFKAVRRDLAGKKLSY